MSDTRFAELLTQLRDAEFGRCRRHDVESVCGALGWAVKDTVIEIPDSQNSGSVYEDDDPYDTGQQWVTLSIDIGVIAPEEFRGYLDQVIAIWASRPGTAVTRACRCAGRTSASRCCAGS